MGSLLYDEDATKEKRERMIQHSLNTTSSSLGLRISGLKVSKGSVRIEGSSMH